MKRILRMAMALMFAATAHAQDRPYGHGDVTLGESYGRLAVALDFRDINEALADQARRKAATPDLGRRGYGCLRRDDPYADMTCVTHDEKIGGAETREIRLQFLNGVLQQFSVTAEIQYLDKVMEAIRARHGTPARSDAAGAFPSWRWANAVSSIVAYGGKDLVFVSFELASYQEAVKARQERPRGPAEFPVR